MMIDVVMQIRPSTDVSILNTQRSTYLPVRSNPLIQVGSDVLNSPRDTSLGVSMPERGGITSHASLVSAGLLVGAVDVSLIVYEPALLSEYADAYTT